MDTHEAPGENYYRQCLITVVSQATTHTYHILNRGVNVAASMTNVCNLYPPMPAKFMSAHERLPGTLQ